MPLMRCRENEKPGWKWGEEGKCYTYQPNSKESENEAKQKAINQGIAMGEISTDTDIDDIEIVDCSNEGGENNSLKTVERFEEAEVLDYTENEEDGFITVELAATRTGVMPYYDWETDEVVMELKPPDEIFSETTMESLKGVPITDRHPPVMVNTENWLDFTRGTTHLDVRKEDNLLVVSETIFDDQLIAYVKSGKKAQVSIGFRADLDEEPGEFEGEEYDRIQRNIRINHVAHVKQGRAGEKVKARIDAVRADSKGKVIGFTKIDNNQKKEKGGKKEMGDVLEYEDNRKLSPLSAERLSIPSAFGDKAIWVDEQLKDDFHKFWDKKIETNENEVELEEVEIGDETVQVVKEDAEKIKAIQDELNEKEELEGKLDSKEDEIQALEERVDELEEQDVESIVQDRLDLIETIRNYIPDFDPSGKTKKDMKTELIQLLDEDFDGEDRADEYINARFDGAMKALDRMKRDSYGKNSLKFKKNDSKNDNINKKRQKRKSLRK